MKGFKVSSHVQQKLLDKHGVTLNEVYECFTNRERPAFEDERADHQTDPPTFWFIAETDKRRILKVIYVEYEEFFAIKSAFDANGTWIEKYEEMCAKFGA